MKNWIHFTLGLLCMALGFGMFAGIPQRYIHFSHVGSEMVFTLFCGILSAAFFLMIDRRKP